MTSPAPGTPPAGPADPAARLRAIATGLGDAGLAAHLDQTAAGRYVTATWRQPGRKELEVIVDEDLYIEYRWWADPGATPAELVRVLAAVLAAITAPPAAAQDGAEP